MPLSWRFRGAVLMVTESGLISNDEIERVILRDALSSPPARDPVRVLWDARPSESPLTSDDVDWRGQVMRLLGEHGHLSRFALVVRPEQRLTLEIGRTQLPNAVSPLAFAVFTEQFEALDWLEDDRPEGDSHGG
jgi:hypothetical protein